MNQEELRRIIERVADNTATDEELRQYNAWCDAMQQDGKTVPNFSEIQAGMLQHINAEIERRPKVIRLSYRIAAAASILLIATAGAYFLFHQKQVLQTAQNNPEQIAPVQKGVTLTLANGQHIQLNTKHSGQIAVIGGTNINQQDNLLSYQGTHAASEVKMNTLTNNGVSKFSITLADGSEATLDIGSSLTYPVAFTSSTRQVSMTGQAYFKVKHLAHQHFFVKAKGQTTEDIGTEFNINAYADEPASKTTLVEGSIRVNEALLKPGQQAIITGSALHIKTADLEAVTAWLQGKIIFEKEPLENILLRVSRIYGVQFIYQDDEVRKLTFNGAVSSTKKLATVLNFFRRAGGVDFLVEGKTVKVFKSKKKGAL